MAPRRTDRGTAVARLFRRPARPPSGSAASGGVARPGPTRSNWDELETQTPAPPRPAGVGPGRRRKLTVDDAVRLRHSARGAGRGDPSLGVDGLGAGWTPTEAQGPTGLCAERPDETREIGEQLFMSRSDGQNVT